MIRLIKTEENHVEAMKDNLIPGMEEHYSWSLKTVNDPSFHSYALICEKDVVAIFYAKKESKTWANAYTLLSKNIFKYPVVFFKSTQAMIDYVKNEMGCTTLKINVNASDTRAFKFARRLKFDIEGFLKNVNVNGAKDMFIMGRVL